MKLKKISLAVALCIFGFAHSQIVSIPDAALKARLIGNNVAALLPNFPEAFNSSVDSNGDGQIQESEAAAVYGLSISTSAFNTLGDIASLEGLQYFTNLKALICDGNNIPAADFTMLPQLKSLHFSSNQANSVAVSGLVNLGKLYLSSNQLVSIDLTGLNQLTILNLYDNTLASVDLTGFSNLTYLDLSENQLTNLELPPMPDLASLRCNNNHLPSLNINTLASLQTLDCSNNPITSINLSGLNNLHELVIGSTLISQLDASQTSAMVVYCDTNPNLTYINVQNGQISLGDPDMLFYPFRFENLPLLTGVCVDLGEEQWLQNASIDLNAVSAYYGPNCSGNPFNAYNDIGGTLTFDNAADGCGAGDTPMMGIMIATNINTNPGSTIYSDTNGHYNLHTAQSSIVITPQVNPSYFTVTPANYTYDFTNTGNNITADFCVTANGVHPDLEVHVSPATGARPGFDASYRILYKNNGNQVQSGTVTFTFDDATLDYVSASILPQTQTGNTGTWNFSNLMPFESREIYVVLNLNSPLETPALNAGDVLTFSAEINAAESDEIPNDNLHSTVQTVVNSFDPNEKYVAEGDKIGISQVGDYLHYTIVFQNSGTADAINVSVNDILSDLLDPTTVQLTAASHPCVATLTAGNRLDFNFTNINLPPESVNEPGSHGFVSFKVKPKNTVVIDDVIENTAAIYFDFNFPIITNTVATTVTNLGTLGFNNIRVSLYPNPVKNALTITLKDNVGVQSILVYNMLGQLVKTLPSHFNGNSMTADISDLQPGHYIVQLLTDKGKTSNKLIKM